jgi:hypothetical protein
VLTEVHLLTSPAALALDAEGKDADVLAGPGTIGSDADSMQEYDSDVVECDHVELDDRDPADVIASKHVSPAPPLGAISPPPADAAGHSYAHLSRHALTAQARLLGEASPGPVPAQTAISRFPAVSVEFLPDLDMPGDDPPTSQPELRISPIPSLAPPSAAVHTARGESAALIAAIVVPPIALLAEAAGSEADMHAPSSESSLPVDLARAERGAVSPRLDSRSSFGLLNPSGSHSTLV